MRRSPKTFVSSTGWVVALSVAALGRSVLAASPQGTCDAMTSVAIPDARIRSAEVIPAADGLPEHCLVVGNVIPAAGFEVRLPSDWNGKLYFAGNGGFAGSIADTTPGLLRGYATASTDTGHQADALDASWALGNRPAEIDYGYRAVHRTAVVAKRIIDRYYGEVPRLSYFDGCSNGGRQALREAEQFPGDFDGIAAGAPALDFTGVMTAANWNMQALFGEPDSHIPLEKVPVIGRAVLASCDGVDGLVDGSIEDPRRCVFEPDTLLCPYDDAPGCLTAAQVQALKKIYAGPADSRGRHLFAGLPVGGETLDHFGWDVWLIGFADFPPLDFVFQDQFLRYLAFPVDDPDFDWTTFDFDSDPPRMRPMGGILNADGADLSAFRAAGGKLLLWQGWSDPIVSASRTIEYYESIRRAMGSAEAGQFAKFFLAPGVAHCGFGTGPSVFDYLTPLEQWVERGIAPESIEASRYDENGEVDRTRPLCAFPKVARYRGTGSIDKAASFRCVDR